MNKTTKQNIFNIVNNVGKVTTKPNVLDNEENVYTKTLKVNKNFKHTNTTDTLKVVSVSLTASTKDFKDATPNNIRFNLQNNNKSWINIFINEAPKELIDFVYINII
jgi:hypothetical protein